MRWPARACNETLHTEWDAWRSLDGSFDKPNVVECRRPTQGKLSLSFCNERNAYVWFKQRIAHVFEQQIKRYCVSIARCNVYRSFSVLSDDVRVGAWLEEHENAAISIGNSRSEMQRRFLQLSTLNVKISAKTEQSLDDRWFCRLDGYVQCCVVVLGRETFIDRLRAKRRFLTFVVTSTCSPFCSRVLMIPTWPFLAAVWILLAPPLFGMCKKTPFLKSIWAQSAWPFKEAMCIRVLPSLVRSKMLARNLSANSSIILACPFSAAKCIGVRSGSWKIEFGYATDWKWLKAFTLIVRNWSRGSYAIKVFHKRLISLGCCDVKCCLPLAVCGVYVGAIIDQDTNHVDVPSTRCQMEGGVSICCRCLCSETEIKLLWLLRIKYSYTSGQSRITPQDFLIATPSTLLVRTELSSKRNI